MKIIYQGYQILLLKNMKNKIELLSPVGSFENLHAAIQGSADAIYFGVEQLNMRAKSISSFSINDLAKIKTICSQLRIKSYITLNTVMYEHDMAIAENDFKRSKKTKYKRCYRC